MSPPTLLIALQRRLFNISPAYVDTLEVVLSDNFYNSLLSFTVHGHVFAVCVHTSGVLYGFY